MLILVRLQQSLINKTTQSASLIDILSYDPFKSRKGVLQKTFNHLTQVFSCKKYEFPRVEGKVGKDERIVQAVLLAADEDFHSIKNSKDGKVYESILKHHQKRAKNILHNMRSTLSHFLLRLVFLHNIHITIFLKSNYILCISILNVVTI